MKAAPRRIGDRDARRLSIVLGIGCVALLPLLCPSPEAAPPSEPPTIDTIDTIDATVADVVVRDASERVARTPVAIDSCEALAQSDDDDDLALVPALCPDSPLTARQARAALFSAGSPAAARALLPALMRPSDAMPAGHTELLALANLVIAPRVPLPEALPDPVVAQVSPVSDEVLSWIRGAEAALVTEGVDHDDRTRARALLAKVHLQALLKLGVVPGEPVPPFARRVAALALHHGRTFCATYWRRRVVGLDELFAETEVQLSRVLSALEATPFVADDVLLADERDGVRAWLSGAGARARVAERRGDGWDGPGESIEAQLSRLVAHGMFDLAVDRAAALAGQGEAPMGLRTLEQLLVEAAAQHDRPEGPARIRERMTRVRARPTPPPEEGPGVPQPVVWPWPSAEIIAADALAWAIDAREAGGFAKDYAAARAIAALADRPDAARHVVKMSQSTDDLAVREAATWAVAQLRARDPGRPSDLHAFADATSDPDRARRLSFAADLVP